MSSSRAIYRARKGWNGFFLLMSAAAAAFGLVWLGLILYSLLSNGIAGYRSRSSPR